ncbi:hypothetical protein SAMN05216474_0442 [Lishizhenia tianjinensis]|uniref:Uncharacterized protein n=1 Tax=Lishizhenia tianjinensis TaxID=477690 RepID=A0A1I6XUC5_9FLAO|nr:hypothetical protein [Lishizhenia tianjinensis]SFT41653.1 hypothetical protein SAMN05216474_0442 [Lishizhenia tianjinensis]
MNTPLLEKTGTRKSTLLVFSAIALYANEVLNKNESWFQISITIFMLLFCLYVFFNELIKIKFSSEEIVIKSILNKLSLNYDDIKKLHVTRSNKYSHFTFRMTSNEGKTYLFHNNNFWSEDLCNLMYKNGVPIEVHKKATKWLSFDDNKEVYTVDSKHPRNEKEYKRKVNIFA